MTVLYTATALAEIEEICSYIAKDNERAAASIAMAIERAVAAIAKRPQYQYRVFYEIAGPDIIVRNVRSTKRLRPWEASER